MERKRISTARRALPGLSLFEFTLYLAIFSIVISICFYGVVRVCGPFVQRSNFCNALSSAYSACDLLVRDVRTASADVQGWEKTDPHEIIFKSTKGYIGWSFENNALMRTVGSYNSKMQLWNKKTRHVATAPIHDVSFAVHTQSDRVTMVAVSCLIKNAHNAHTIKQEIVLRNRNIT